MPAEPLKERPNSATLRDQLLAAYQRSTGKMRSKSLLTAEIESVQGMDERKLRNLAPILKGQRVLKMADSIELSLVSSH